MTPRLWCCALLLTLAGTLAQTPQQFPPTPEPERPRLPNGKSMQEEILKADFEKTLKDASELLDLAEQLKEELEKNDRHVLSVSTLKKTEEIEKLSKRIRSRLRRY